MLEKMGEFFDARLDGYEDHQLNCIEGAREFYPFSASLLPNFENARVLDLGCGTGLELNYYFELNPASKLTCIDLAHGMLAELKRKFAKYELEIIVGSYFDVPLGENTYDSAISVESLHHFTKEEKTPLYKKIRESLRDNGYFILTDYFADTELDEKRFRSELTRLKKEQGIHDGEFYHYDTPLTLENELDALRSGGFSKIELLGRWGATCCLKCIK